MDFDTVTASARLQRFSLRQMVLGLVFAGIVGLGAELLLLEHTESLSQWIPLIVLAAGLISGISVAISPGKGSIAVFRVVMVVFAIVGILGLYLHYTGNVEFALERDPSLRGFRLLSKALRGATPALAPAVLAQIGLLGLAYTHGRDRAGGREAEKIE